MKHVIMKPGECPCDKSKENCPTCDWGLCVCKVCGKAEADLINTECMADELLLAAFRLMELAAMADKAANEAIADYEYCQQQGFTTWASPNHQRLLFLARAWLTKGTS